MKERISVLVDLVPRYGEILLGVGCIALENNETLLENNIAREEIKEYLLNDAPKIGTLTGLAKAPDFQKMAYKYTGKFISTRVLGYERKGDKIVNITLLDFFQKSIWPILVKRYMDNIKENIDNILVSINVKKNVFFAIYGEDNADLFFKEFKEFLYCNYIIICEASMQSNGDMLLKLMIPVPPHKHFEPF